MYTRTFRELIGPARFDTAVAKFGGKAAIAVSLREQEPVSTTPQTGLTIEEGWNVLAKAASIPIQPFEPDIDWAAFDQRIRTMTNAD